MPLTDYLQADVIFERNSTIATCRLYYSVVGDATVNDGNIVNIADKIFGHVAPTLAACIVNSAKVKSVYVRWIHAIDSYEGSTTTAAFTGTGGAVDPLPEEDAVVLQRRSGFRGRANNGRIFMPFVPETLALDSALTAAGIEKYLAACTQLQAAIATVEADETPTMIPCLLNRKNSLVRNVMSYRVLPEVRSRRDRRQPKRVFAMSAPEPVPD